MSTIIVDTRGRSCPEPVLMTKKALEKTAERYEILIDNQTALGNISRLLKSRNRDYRLERKEDEFVLTIG